MRIRPVNMEFRDGTSFLSESPEAYERLILDAMRGDATLFTRHDEIEALWGIIDLILTAWHEDTTSPIPQDPCGTAGPVQADQLLDPACDQWWCLLARPRGRVVDGSEDVGQSKAPTRRD